jgi:HAMP domain-containing protein
VGVDMAVDFFPALQIVNSFHMSTHEQRQKAVQQWLNERFRNRGSVPQFEQNEKTISMLYELATINQQQKHLYEKISHDFKTKTREYQSRSLCHKIILKQSHLFFLPTASLNNTQTSLNASSGSSFNNSTLNNTSILSASTSTTTRPVVRALSELANVLELSDIRPSSFILAINDLMNEHDNVVDKRIETSNSLHDLNQKTLQVMERLQYLKQLQTEFQAEQERRDRELIIQKRMENIAYLTRKAQDYEQEIQPLQNQLQDILETAQLDSLETIQHRTLLKLYQDVIEMRAALEPKLQKIASYHNLPPDVDMVKYRIMEAKNELAALNQEFNRQTQEMW